MKIWAQMLVKNEERYVWFAVMSVIEYLDRILIWDTGSNDNTVKIIQAIKEKYPQKVDFEEVGEVDIDGFTKVRQRMLDATKADWFLVVDGDEIWWEESIKKLVKAIQREGDKIESAVVPLYSLVGDIYHYQEEAAGKYHLAGRRGHLNLRAVNRKIPGLKSDRPHGTWGWVDGKGRMIQDRSLKKTLYVDAPYFHATFLPRSGTRDQDLKVPKRAHKLKHEMGISFPRDFYYPEVFFKPRPKIVPSPWVKMDKQYEALALIQTPLKKIKRRVIDGKPGY